MLKERGRKGVRLINKSATKFVVTTTTVINFRVRKGNF